MVTVMVVVVVVVLELLGGDPVHPLLLQQRQHLLHDFQRPRVVQEGHDGLEEHERARPGLAHELSADAPHCFGVLDEALSRVLVPHDLVEASEPVRQALSAPRARNLLGGQREQKQWIRSSTKELVGWLVGVATKKGRVEASGAERSGTQRECNK